MKTIEKVQSEIQLCRSIAGKNDTPKKEIKRLEKQLRKLYQCQLYLETSPTEDFIKKQQR